MNVGRNARATAVDVRFAGVDPTEHDLSRLGSLGELASTLGGHRIDLRPLHKVSGILTSGHRFVLSKYSIALATHP